MLAAGRTFPFGPVGQRGHPVHDPHRHRFAADRADSVMLGSGLRVPTDAALTMAIVMVLAFLREKLHRPQKMRRVSRLQRLEERLIGEFPGKDGSLPG